MTPQVLIYLTRTPLHVGAGASVGAIDQPIQRERATGFPIIPGSSLKGVFRDAFGQPDDPQTDWLFGVGEKRDENANSDGEGSRKFVASAGALQFAEARLLAFPVRSARGGYAFLVSPTTIQRARRDGVFSANFALPTLGDHEAACLPGMLDIQGKIVLEEYAYTLKDWPQAEDVAKAVIALAGDDPVWKDAAKRVVLVNDHALSHYARHACEVAQHVRIDDKTGTADDGGLFNQENVPGDTLFYSVAYAQPGRGTAGQSKTPEDALNAFRSLLKAQPVLQFGGDATTGCGWTSVRSL